VASDKKRKKGHKKKELRKRVESKTRKYRQLPQPSSDAAQTESPRRSRNKDNKENGSLGWRKRGTTTRNC